MPVTDQERIDFLEYWPSLSCDASGLTDKYTMDSYADRGFPTAREAIDDTIQRHPDWRERDLAERETRRLELVKSTQAEHDKQLQLTLDLDDSLTKCALAWKIEINVTGKMK